MITNGKAPTDVLLLFARAPMLGTVKSRLAATLGPEAALAAYRELFSKVAANLAALDDLTLCITPDGSMTAFEPWRQPQWRVWGQGDGDLGARLERAFARAFAEDAKRVVIVGADCPRVRAEHIREAWQRLGETDSVLGPATDGGYWLIGLSRMVPELFRDMPWGSAALFPRTMETALKQGLSVALLEALGDIDTEEDWIAYKKTSSAARVIDNTSL